MQLNYHRSGQGRPLVMLHGLFGSWDNLGASVKALAEQYDVVAVDLRNHGRSDHQPDHSYPLMADDLLRLLDSLSLEQVMLLGHSMGGKVAMEFALTHPERVERLIIVDIAPVEYPHHHTKVFDGLKSVDLNSIKSRNHADLHLSQHVEEPGVRAFLLKNLYREEGNFKWRMNIDALETQYVNIAAAPRAGLFAKPTLFIKGADSDYLTSDHQLAVSSRFPKAKLKIIAGTGHWPHAEKPDLFLRIVRDFISA